MRKVSEGVYARVDAGGKVRGYTGYVPDATTKSGKRSVGTFAKAKDAKDARAAELGKPKGPGVDGGETVSEFRERWEREFGQHNRTVTKKGNHYALNAFVAAHGQLRLRDLGDKHYDEVRSWGRTATIGYVAVARKMLNDAIEDKKLARGMNPLANLGRGKGRGRADITIITEAELYELADCAMLALGSDFGPVFRGHILFSAHTALRPSEARALMHVHVRPPELDVFDNYGDDSEKTAPKNGKRQTVACLPAARLGGPRRDAGQSGEPLLLLRHPRAAPDEGQPARLLGQNPQGHGREDRRPQVARRRLLRGDPALLRELDVQRAAAAR